MKRLTRMLLGGAVVLLIGAGLAVAGGPAGSESFPGENGKIAFVNVRVGNTDVYVMDADGGNQTRLTNNPADDFSPSWSADGTQITFTRQVDDTEVYRMAPDGTAQVNLTNNLDAEDFESSWQPTGPIQPTTTTVTTTTTTTAPATTAAPTTPTTAAAQPARAATAQPTFTG